MKYGSVCSGIEAATVAWHPLGWEPVFFSEIEPFPSAVLAHHYPGVPNFGDFTKIQQSPEPISLLVGGTPCQSFSVAGLRGGMADARGNLALEFLRLAERLGPAWVVWENVPGVLSSNDGRDFGAFLGGLAELGYGWAYRVLDAQYFGVPQRRRRVFAVGCLGGWRGAAAVLFERHSLSGHPAPGREAGEGFAGDIEDGFERDVPLIPVCWDADKSENEGSTIGYHYDISPCLRTENKLAVAVWDPRNITSKANRTRVEFDSPSPTLHSQALAIIGPCVRRVTPLEYERLQGFPDGHTAVPYRGKPATDGPRYKALGNSMAVPCMAWIGQRIDMADRIMAPRRELQ